MARVPVALEQDWYRGPHPKSPGAPKRTVKACSRLARWFLGGTVVDFHRQCGRREAHFFTVPLLATPAVAFAIDDAGAAAAAAWIVVHLKLLSVG